MYPGDKVFVTDDTTLWFEAIFIGAEDNMFWALVKKATIPGRWRYVLDAQRYEQEIMRETPIWFSLEGLSRSTQLQRGY